MNTALKNFQILDNVMAFWELNSWPLLKPLTYKYETPYQVGEGTHTAHDVIRKHVEYLNIDRPLYSDHNKMKELVKSCEILVEVEKAIGPLN